MNRVEKVTEALKEFDASIRSHQWRPGDPVSKDHHAANRAVLNKIRKQVVKGDYEKAKSLVQGLPVRLLALVPKCVRSLVKYKLPEAGAQGFSQNLH